MRFYEVAAMFLASFYNTETLELRIKYKLYDLNIYKIFH